MQTRIPMDVLRAAIQDQAGQSSMRCVAREIGLSARAVEMFLCSEGTPRNVTERKIRDWYLRMFGASAPVPPHTVSVVRAAVALLTPHIPADEAVAAGEQVLERVCEIHRRHGIPVPPAVRDLLREMQSGRPRPHSRDLADVRVLPRRRTARAGSGAKTVRHESERPCASHADEEPGILARAVLDQQTGGKEKRD